MINHVGDSTSMETTTMDIELGADLLQQEEAA
jgi:hypothetical protein